MNIREIINTVLNAGRVDSVIDIIHETYYPSDPKDWTDFCHTNIMRELLELNPDDELVDDHNIILQSVMDEDEEEVRVYLSNTDGEELGLDFECDAIDVRYDPRRRGVYADEMHILRGRRGLTREDAVRLLRSTTYFAPMMVRMGDADGYLGGVSHQYPDIVKPCLQVIGPSPDSHRIVGMYMMTVNGQLMFIGDATINIYPDARTLAEIAIQTAKVAKRFGVKPKDAMLSFSNFGTSAEMRTDRIEEAIQIVRELDPDLIIDGPMQADTALVTDIQQDYPFMSFSGPANVLICPNLASANIAYKLLQRIAGAEMTGPILEGLSRPAHVLQRRDSVRDVVHMAAICAVDAQRASKERLID